MMDQYTPILPVLSDEEASPRAKAVFDDIEIATRETDFVNNFWRARQRPGEPGADWAGTERRSWAGAPRWTHCSRS